MAVSFLINKEMLLNTDKEDFQIIIIFLTKLQELIKSIFEDGANFSHIKVVLTASTYKIEIIDEE